MSRQEPLPAPPPRWAGRRGKRGAASESGSWKLNVDSHFRWRDVAWLNDPPGDPKADNERPIWASCLLRDGEGFGFSGGKPPRFRVGYKDPAALH